MRAEGIQPTRADATAPQPETRRLSRDYFSLGVYALLAALGLAQVAIAVFF